jgi:CRP/FNR family cyclic AMP-dependent transcriptional regulator
MKLHPHFLYKDLFRRFRRQAQPIVDVLRQNVLFSTLTKKELRYLAGLVYERVYQPDEPIFKQNERGFGMYVIARGSVAIKSQQGAEDLFVTELSVGSFFGELALIDPNNLRTASAFALERTVLIGFFKPDLMDILERKPEMGSKILFQLAMVLGERLMKTTEKMTLLNQAKGVSQDYDEVV